MVEPTPQKNDGVRQLGWLFHSQLNGTIKFMFQTTNQIPSGYVKIAIENCHRNSGFTLWIAWWFSSSLCKRLPGRVYIKYNHPPSTWRKEAPFLRKKSTTAYGLPSGEAKDNRLSWLCSTSNRYGITNIYSCITDILVKSKNNLYLSMYN